MTEKIYLIFSLLFTVTFSVKSQNSNFDDLTLAPDSFWDGSDMSGRFISGDAYFFNTYTQAFSSWSGFAYSNMKDDSTAGYTNLYSSYYGGAYNGTNYAVANTYGPVGIKFNTPRVYGFQVTNTTYAGLSMKNGDSFAKKFGGVTGNDPDWFKLEVVGYLAGVAKADTVEFYLADFRFADNNLDYIVEDWKRVDLVQLGTVDSLSFILSSSDAGQWGMNTPAYFAIDEVDFVISDVKEQSGLNNLNIFPNPASVIVNVKSFGSSVLTILDVTGKVVMNQILSLGNNSINVAGLSKGIYIMKIEGDNKLETHKLIKN